MRTDGDRLWKALADISQFGATENGGLNRLAASVSDGQARDYFVERAKLAGCDIRVDQLGNIFARRKGSSAKSKAILIGSHLDSQPFGGKYDGIYGVVAGLEVLETLHQHAVSHEHDVVVACWTNEEGARFAPAMMGAAFFVEKFQAPELLARVDSQGESLESALSAIGYLGTDSVSPDEFGAYVEIHIEQGPLLEQKNIPIGVVSGVQAMRWQRVTISGTSGHAGTYPMEIRRDALVAASELVGQVEQIGLRRPEIGRATVGYLNVHPNSPNVIPGRAELMVEFRHPSPQVIDEMTSELNAAIQRISTARDVTVESLIELNADPVIFNATLVGIIESVCKAGNVDYLTMLSGAGHDAVQVNSRIPSAMIFIPCVEGISHAENEDITFVWAAQGAQTLLDSILAIDASDLQ